MTQGDSSVKALILKNLTTHFVRCRYGHAIYTKDAARCFNPLLCFALSKTNEPLELPRV